MFKHLLIATDGSAVSNKAAKAAIALARALSAKVTVYCAIEPLQPVYLDGYAFNPQVLEDIAHNALQVAQKRVDAIGKLAKVAGVPCAAMVTNAVTAYEGIIEIANKRRCDVICMASHGRRGLAHLMMGSVTQKVLSHSKIPVVVYR